MANDFSGDAHCIALWRFEDSPGFTVDSIGGNNLTNDGADESATEKEGAQSARFLQANTDKMTITDAAQDAGFPWRYDDGAGRTKTFSICFWVRLLTLPGTETACLIDKYNTTGSLRVFAVWIANTSNKLTLVMGKSNGTGYDEIIFGTACVINRWYHVGVTYDVSDRSGRIRVWDDTAGALLDSDETGTFTATDARDVGLTIGARGDGNREHDGYLDEIVVFDDVLSTAEIDQIRAGTYAEGVGTMVPMAWHHLNKHC